MNKRIFGIETEFGCMTDTERVRGTSEGVAARVRDYVFDVLELGLRDIHYRDWGEPPGNGGFLFNGGRLYIDMGHLEYATPECGTLFDLVAYDKAIECIINSILADTGQPTAFFKNNIDHFTGATFGCHENFQVSRDVPFYRVVIPTLMPFFVTRQIYAGAGRVGVYDEMIEFGDFQQELSEQQNYQISQRADHIVTDIYEWIQFSRAIINTRDEPLSDYTKYRRLHLLVGDSNMSEYATALKIGTLLRYYSRQLKPSTKCTAKNYRSQVLNLLIRYTRFDTSLVIVLSPGELNLNLGKQFLLLIYKGSISTSFKLSSPNATRKPSGCFLHGSLYSMILRKIGKALSRVLIGLRKNGCSKLLLTKRNLIGMTHGLKAKI